MNPFFPTIKVISLYDIHRNRGQIVLRMEPINLRRKWRSERKSFGFGVHKNLVSLARKLPVPSFIIW
jgi:hypothetical protein